MILMKPSKSISSSSAACNSSEALLLFKWKMAPRNIIYAVYFGNVKTIVVLKLRAWYTLQDVLSPR